jgi:uncharacterized membrane protein
VTKSRIEAFSDGVFAIAITLLVLTISPPTDYHNLAHQFAERWPALAAYVVSFIVIGIMWLNHHSIFSYFDRVDRNLVYLNLLLLLSVAFIPYPTAILGEALRQGEGTRVAAVVYSVTMTLNGYSWAALWLLRVRPASALDPAFPEGQRRLATLLFTSGTIMYTLSIAVAVINALACLAYLGLLALYYAFDPISRRAGAVAEDRERDS